VTLPHTGPGDCCETCTLGLRSLSGWISARCLHCSIRRPIAAKVRATIHRVALSARLQACVVPSAAARSS
jgi:hypothetical protein